MKKFHWLNEDERSSLVHDRYAIVYKGKNGITVGHVPKYVSKQMHFFNKYCGREEMKVKIGKRRNLNMFSVSSEHEKMLLRFEEHVKDVLSKEMKTE